MEHSSLRPLVRILIVTFLVLTLVTLSSVYQKFDSLEDRLLTLEQRLDESRNSAELSPTTAITSTPDPQKTSPGELPENLARASSRPVNRLPWQ